MASHQAALRQSGAFVDWILAEPERLSRFMALTGWQPHDLRASLTSVELAQAVLDHLMTDERQLLAACAALSLPPETPARLQHVLSGDHGDGDAVWG